AGGARRPQAPHSFPLLCRATLSVVIRRAAARPLGRRKGAGGGGGGGAHEPTAVVVILDNSPSSGAVVDGRLVLDRLRVAARGSIGRTTSADRVWLMLAVGVLRGGTREVLIGGVVSVAAGLMRVGLVQGV